MDKIGILGFGFVGQAVYAGIIPTQGTVIWDPPKRYKDFYKETKDSIKKIKAIFVCLPTPMLDNFDSITGRHAQDSSYIEDALDHLVKIKYDKLVIVKSTTIPSILKKYEKKLRLIANPEFLNANTAIHDFLNQKTIVLGGQIDRLVEVKDLYINSFGFETKDPINFIPCTLEEAMHIKYIHNLRHAYEVLFWNYVYEVYGNHRKYGSLYEKITERKGEMYKVAADGKLGYGGACFPKDVYAADAENPHPLTRFMIKYNNELRK